MRHTCGSFSKSVVNFSDYFEKANEERTERDARSVEFPADRWRIEMNRRMFYPADTVTSSFHVSVCGSINMFTPGPTICVFCRLSALYVNAGNMENLFC
jgi:hypothetical protein